MVPRLRPACSSSITGPCTDVSATYLATTQLAGGCNVAGAAPTPANTFTYSGGFLNMLVRPLHALAGPTSSALLLDASQATGNNYRLNGVPRVRMLSSDTSVDSVYTATFSWTAFTGASQTHEVGLEIFDFDANGKWRPLINFMYTHVTTNSGSNTFQLRIANSNGVGYTYLGPNTSPSLQNIAQFTTSQVPSVYAPTGMGATPVQLAIQRNRRENMWRFYYSTPVVNGGRWTNLHWMDVYDTMLPWDMQMNASVAAFAASDITSSTLPRTALLDKMTKAVGDAVDIFLRNMTVWEALTPTTGLCNMDRAVTRTGLYYDNTRRRYSYTLRGVANALSYRVTVTSVSTTGTSTSFTAPGSYAPVVSFPVLLSSPTSTPALFLDALSLAPGDVFKWRDSSGNGRDVVQYNPNYQPTSYGVTPKFPTGGVYFPLRRNELYQEDKGDSGLEMGNSPAGMSIFTLYHLGATASGPSTFPLTYYYTTTFTQSISPYQANFGLLSRMPAVHSNTSGVTGSTVNYWTASSQSSGVYGQAARPLNDDPGWELWSWHSWYSESGTVNPGAGMRVIASKAAGSSKWNPNVNHVGVMYANAAMNYCNDASCTGPDWAFPTLYTYNYYPVPAGGYAIGASTIAAGQWVVDGCRGINFGLSSDQCMYPNPTSVSASTTLQSASGIPPGYWKAGFGSGHMYQYYGTEWFIRPTTNILPLAAQNNIGNYGLFKVSDALHYYRPYYTYMPTSATKYFWGNMYGILIYKDAIVNRADKMKVQQWLGERYGTVCPVLSLTNVVVSQSASGTSSPACLANFGLPNYGAPMVTNYVPGGTTCSMVCGANKQRLGGFNVATDAYTCSNNGYWPNKGVFCGTTCTPMSMPINADTCMRHYVREQFSQAAGTLARLLPQYDTAPQLPYAAGERIWSFTGTQLKGNVPYAAESCGPVTPSVFATNRPTWGDADKLMGSATYAITVVLEDNGAAAGIAFKVAQQTGGAIDYYRAVIIAGSTRGDVELVRIAADGRTSVTNVGSGTFTLSTAPLPGTPYLLEVLTSGTITVRVNGVQVFQDTDITISNGGVGAYVESGTAYFDDMSVIGACSSNGNCNPTEGGACEYRCAPGFTSRGPTIRTCGGSGYDSPDSLTCVPQAPTPASNNYVFNMFEDAAASTIIGNVSVSVTSSTSLNSVVLFSIEAGNNETMRSPAGTPLTPAQEYPDMFAISLCGGLITVNQAGAFYRDQRSSYTLTIRAALALDQSVFVTFPVTINVLAARKAPLFLDVNPAVVNRYPLLIDENSPVGTRPVFSSATTRPLACVNPGQVCAFQREVGQVLTYTIVGGNDYGFFKIDNATGQLTVAKLGLDFEGPAKAGSPAFVPNSFELLIVARDRDYPQLFAVVTAALTVVDGNDAPIAPDQQFDKMGGKANNWTILSLVPDPDFQPNGIDPWPIINNPIGTIRSVTDDDFDTVSYIMVSQRNIATRQTVDFFQVNTTTGVLAVARDISLYDVRRNQSVVDGRLTHAVYDLTVRLQDSGQKTTATGTTDGPKSSVIAVRVYILVDSSSSVTALIGSAAVTSGSVATLNTAGGDVITVSGTNFNSITTAQGNNQLTGSLSITIPGGNTRTHPFLDPCTVTSDTTITCPRSGPGYGTNLGLILRWNDGGEMVSVSYSSGLPALFSYTAPAITGVAVDTTVLPVPANKDAYLTAGGQSFLVSASNTGPVGTPVQVTYATADLKYRYTSTTATVLTASTRTTAGTIKASTVAGMGARLIVGLIAGGQTADVDATVYISYAAPVITGFKWALGTTVVAFDSLTTVQPATPQRIDILGNNFGPVTSGSDVVVSMVYNGAAIPIDGSAPAAYALTMNTAWSKYAGNVTTVVCMDVPSGFGRGYDLVVTVGGQSSTAYRANLGYALPTVGSISGLGTKNAVTSGGQTIVLTGTNLGPSAVFHNPTPSSNIRVSTPYSITYGPSGFETAFTARNCVGSTTGTTITCVTDEGSGNGLNWRVTVGGLSPATNPTFSTAYGYPVVTSLSRLPGDVTPNFQSDQYATPGYDSITRTGEVVYIDGSNFGPMVAGNTLNNIAAPNWAVRFVLKLEQLTSAKNNTLGAASDGTITTVIAQSSTCPTPTAACPCVMTIPHLQIKCNMPPGSGKELAWTVKIDGLIGTGPLMGYRAPRLDAATMLDGSPANAISSDGGQTIVIKGSGFGPSGLNCRPLPSGVVWPEAGAVQCLGYIQSVTYGPSGTDYTANLIHLVDPNTLYVRTQPGFGKKLKFAMVVAEQPSVTSTATITYAVPVVTGLSPATGPTNPPADSYAVTVTGRNFGLQDNRAGQSILFGNPADRTDLAPIPTFNPQVGDFDGDGIIDHRVSFFLPNGVLPDRVVRVVVHPRGVPSDSTAVVSDPFDSPIDQGRGKPASYFDYQSPAITAVVVSAVPMDAATTVWLFQRGFTSAQILGPDLRRLTILGSNFGAAATGDAVVRSLLWTDCTMTEATGVSCDDDHIGVPSNQGEVFSWSNNAIVAYTFAPEGKLYLQLSGSEYDGSAVAVQSNTYVYKTLAPAIGNILDNIILPTSGGAIVRVEMYNLDTLSSNGRLDVQVHTQDDPVTGDPIYSLATIVNAQGLPFANFNAMKAALVDPVRTAGLSAGTPSTSWVYTIPIKMPAGEGSNRAIQVLRDTETSLPSDIRVSYAAPTVSSWQVFDDVSGSWITGSISASLVDIVVPALPSKFRLIGSNFGLCPKVIMGDLPRAVYVRGAGGASCTHPSTLDGVEQSTAPNNHTYLTFMTQPGQGTGQDDLHGAVGYRFELAAGGQSTASQMYGPSAVTLRWRYLAPQITSIRPVDAITGVATGRTIGGETLTIKGYHLGFRAADTMSALMTVFIGSAECTGLAYTPLYSTDTQRRSEQTLTCTIPEGSGAGHTVNFKAVQYACTDLRSGAGCGATRPAAFSYRKPHITAIYGNGTGTQSGALGADAMAYAAYLSGDQDASSAAPAWLHAYPLPTDTTEGAATYASILRQVAQPGVELISTHGFPLRLPSVGGQLMAIVGDNFGTLDRSAHCLFFAWGGRDRLLSPDLVCDNANSFLGEEEVPDVAILHWSHTLILFIAPPGYGGRELVPVVRGQAMPWAAGVHYQQPAITAPLSPARGDTEGNTNVTITGTDFGFAPVSTSSLRPSFPLALPTTITRYLHDARLPMAAMRVNFFRKCISNHLDVNGAPATTTSRCTMPPARDFYHDHGRIFFPTAPGIGVNRTVNVEILDSNSTTGAAIHYVSNNATFKYNPPFVFASNPRPVRMDSDPESSYNIQLPGLNLGNPPSDAQLSADPASAWSPEEMRVAVDVAGVHCTDANRFVTATTVPTTGETVISVELRCNLPRLTVGFKNLSYAVAGQSNFNSEAAEGGYPANVVFMACRAGYFGYPGETCADCPTGAECRGFDSRPVIIGTDNSTEAFKQKGKHTYPAPLAGYYNLNSTDSNVESLKADGKMDATASQYVLACPPAVRDQYPNRDVCIVACEPAEACMADNHCAEGYRSLSPQFRCSYCDLGYYKRNNECVKCPNSPWALVIGFCALVAVGAGAAYFLNKKKVNIAFIAIGVDWAQVIAIFAASKVAWPPVVKELFNILSAFNLNIEIVAPECIVPDLQFKQKWAFIMILPLALTGLFMLITAGQVFYRSMIKGRKVTLANQGSSFASMVLLLMYVLYIYLTRNILDIFNCQPREPDEGKYYLTVGNGEECYVKGGTQDLLRGPAVVAAIVYIAGYPITVATILWNNRKLAVEDQLLRAKGVGDDKLSNPRAYVLRKRFSRVYYQFKPESVMWVLAILLRKFCLAATYILFNRNASFQLAAALLVLFVAYAAQMKAQPYMGPGDFEGVLRRFENRVFTGDVAAADVWTKVKNVESRGRKTVHRNVMTTTGKVDVGALLGLLRGWLFAYNTVEEILLFSAGTVALMGIMYASLSAKSSNYSDARDSVTWVIVAAIILTIIYFFTVVFTEVYVMWTMDVRRKNMEAQAKRRKVKGLAADSEDTPKSPSSSMSLGVSMASMDVSQLGTVSTDFNPMFEKGGQSTAGLREAVAGTDDVPDGNLWRLFRQGYQELHEDLERLSKETAEIRIRRQRMEEAAAALEMATGRKIDLPEIPDGQGGKIKAGKRKQEFGPVGSDDVSPTASPLNAFRRTPSMAGRSPLGAVRGASGTSLKSVRSMTTPRAHAAADE